MRPPRRWQGVDLKEWFRRALASTEELEYAEALDWYGLAFKPTDETAKKASAEPPKKPLGDAAFKTSEKPASDQAKAQPKMRSEEVRKRWRLEIQPNPTEAQQAHLRLALKTSRRNLNGGGFARTGRRIYGGGTTVPRGDAWALLLRPFRVRIAKSARQKLASERPRSTVGHDDGFNSILRNQISAPRDSIKILPRDWDTRVATLIVVPFRMTVMRSPAQMHSSLFHSPTGCATPRAQALTSATLAGTGR